MDSRTEQCSNLMDAWRHRLPDFGPEHSTGESSQGQNWSAERLRVHYRPHLSSPMLECEGDGV